MKKRPPGFDELRAARDSVLRAFSLVVTDRRWAAPLSAMALGFGLFLGVAIGPGTAGSLAGSAGQIIALAPEEEGPEPSEVDTEPTAAEAEPEAESAPPESEPFEEAFPEPALLPEPVAEPPVEEEAPPGEGPAPEEGEEGEAQELKGTVVHANPAAASYAMAIAGGELVSIHAKKLPSSGEKLSVEATPLDNNTFAEEGRTAGGKAGQATARGVVTYVNDDPAAPAYTLSGRGSSILIHLPASPEPQLPTLGAYATVGVGFEPAPPAAAPEAPPAESPGPGESCSPDPTLKVPPAPDRVLVQRSLKAEPEPATYFDLAGIVSAVCADAGQLLLSADDLRAVGEDLLLAVPDGLPTAKLKAGDSVVATATVEEDGSLTLAGLAGDEGRKGAEDAALAFGDLKR